MKIRILIKENLYKIYNILPLIENNEFLAQNAKNVEYFNESNWSKVFEKTVEEIKNNKFEKICVFDEDGSLPFIFFTKQIGIVAAIPPDVERARLSRAHNNANCVIMSCKYVPIDSMNVILNTFFKTEHDGGRHSTRVKLMQVPFKKHNSIYTFDESLKDTIVICSDHAGFNLKESIKKYLIEHKHLSVIDVGCHSSNSTHYPFFGIALVLNAKKACCGIGVCSTAVGIANTFNKFKGINSIICSNPEQAKLARSKYNANVLALGANFIDLETAKKTVDEFLKTKLIKNQFMSPMDQYGYSFDIEAFKKIEFDPNIEIPDELKK